MERFLRGIRRVNIGYVLDAWKLFPAIVAAPMYRLCHPDVWVVCEDPNEARDNGYWFFKYVCEHHPEQEIVYAILRHSPDYGKVSDLGKTVEYGSLLHWIIYLASTKKISSQKAGNPNAALFYLLEVYGFLKDKRVFLQHGVTINDGKWLYYEATRMLRFICGSQREYEYIRQRFGYPSGNVVYTGFCRFDNLHHAKPSNRQILIMPSWREWIADEDWRLKEYEGTTCIPETNYFKKWTEFLRNERLVEMAQAYGVTFVFYPHRNMQKYRDFFPESTKEVRILTASETDLQRLLINASLLVTDYSSVFFDFAYMKKPVIFYQFDLEQFRANQYAEGWFAYQDNPYGSSFDELGSVLKAIEDSIMSDFTVSDRFLAEHAADFPLYDQSNCSRVFEVVRSA